MKKKYQSTPIQKFVQDAKNATYLKYMDKFGEDDKTKWLDVLYALKEDIDKNIQRLENNKK